MAPSVTQLVMTSNNRVPTEKLFWMPPRAPEMTPWS